MYFKTETDMTQNLIDDFWLSVDLYIGRILREKNSTTEVILEEAEVLYAELYCVKIVRNRRFSGPYLPIFELNLEISVLDKRAKGATSSYSLTDNFLECIFSVFMAKNL